MDIDLTEAGLLAVDWSAQHNTLTSRPEDSSDLLGYQVVVRPHWTLSQVYARDTFIGSNVPEEADQVLFFNGSDFDTYFLLQAEGYDQWVAQADDSLASADQLIIPPGVGSFIKHPEGAETISLMLTGEARATEFAQPLATGYNLLASPHPIDLDFGSRGLLLGDGFLGSRAFFLKRSGPSRLDYLIPAVEESDD